MKTSELRQLIRQVIKQNKSTLIKESFSQDGLSSLIRTIGYSNFENFFQDNPGAVEVVTQ